MGRPRAVNDPSVRLALTAKQREVLSLIADGKTNAEIADRLGVSLDGAKWHVREIFSRLGVDSREDASEWWRRNRGRGGRSPGWLPWPAWIAAGSLVVAGAAAVGVVTLVQLDDEPGSLARTGVTATITIASPPVTATPAAVAPKAQPALVEVATGESWRILRADDGRPLPSAADAVLAIRWDGRNGSPPFLDILDIDGRIAARIEVGYNPMARLNPSNGTVVISDYGLASDGTLAGPRVLVFELATLRLSAAVPLPSRRIRYNIFVNAITLSADGRWLYWLEQTFQPDPPSCASGGDAAVCDLIIVHAVNLSDNSIAPMAVKMPRACVFPSMAPFLASTVLVQCGPRQIVDASRQPGDDAVRAPDALLSIPIDHNLVYLVAVSARFGQDNVGTFVGVALLNPGSGNTIITRSFTDTWAATLIDENTALLMRSDGQLEHMHLATGAEGTLPYRLDPGLHGGDVALVR